MLPSETMFSCTCAILTWHADDDTLVCVQSRNWNQASLSVSGGDGPQAGNAHSWWRCTSLFDSALNDQKIAVGC